MTTEHQTTTEEKVFWTLREEKWDILSEAARSVLMEAQSAAYAADMVHNYCFQPEEYDEAMEKMRLAAAKITDHDHKILAKLWCAALAAAASIDPEDFETSVGHKVCRADLHRYYRMLSGMVEKTLQEKRFAEIEKEIAQREPVEIDDLDIPF